MPWLIPAVSATLAGTLLLAFVYSYLYFQDGEDYLGIWALGWIIYALRFVFQLWMVLDQEWSVLQIANQSASLISGLLLLWGLYRFLQKPVSKWWFAVGGLGLIWIVWGVLANFSFLLLTVPTFTLLAGLYIWMGIVFIQMPDVKGMSPQLTGWAFIAWGIHKADFPFLRPIEALASWGYLLAAMLTFLVALGILLIYFQKTRQSLRESEARFRRLAENASDLIYRYRLQPSPAFDYVSPAAFAITGYTPAEHYADPQLVYKLVHPDDRQQLTSITIASIDSSRPLVLRWIRKDGQIIWTEQRNVPVYDEAGNLVALEGIARDITDRKQAEEQIQELNAALEQRVMARTAQLQATNRELEAFAYSVSHDLRTPLRSIDGFSLALLEDYADQLEPEAQNYLKRVRAASQRMGHLIDDLLGLSRLTRNKMHYEPVDLSELGRQIVANLRSTEPDRQVTVWIGADLVVEGDVRLLQIVLENLLANAWKFTRKQSSAKIEFDKTHTAGQDIYYVRDDGAGFDMAYGDKLFGAFQRLHATNEFEGNGIGLATVQRIIHRHGGQVWAEGQVDQGATFYFTLSGQEVDID